MFLCVLVEQRLKSHSTMLDLWRLIRLILEWIQHVLKKATKARDRRECERFEEIPKARETRVALWFVFFNIRELTPEWDPKAREIQALERFPKAGEVQVSIPFLLVKVFISHFFMRVFLVFFYGKLVK